MKTIGKAEEYLSKDLLTNCGLLQVIRRGSAEIIRAESAGVLLYDSVSEAYMLSAEYTSDVLGWFSNLSCGLIFLTSSDFAPYLIYLYGFNNLLECFQFMYTGKEPIEYEKRLCISPPTDDEMEIIRKCYKKLSDEDLIKIRSLGNIYAAHDMSGEMAGFVGSHLEGSMGLLEILPGYRRLGYGYELECFMINRFIEKSLIPFCHVEVNNEKSINLQNKLGLAKAAGRVCWLY